jgi:hypothetical protein
MNIILGSSPNALALAQLLLKQGEKVQVIETASDFGAPYVTEAGLELGLDWVHFDEQLSQELGLKLEKLEHTGRSALKSDGGWLRITRQAVSGASSRDAERWPQFVQLLDQAAPLLREMQMSHLPVEAWRELGRRQSMEVLRLPWMSLRDLLDEWFEDETLKGLLAEVALEHVAIGPFACGTVFPLLVRWARGEVLAPATLKGGSASLVSALKTGLPDIVHQEGRARLGDGGLELNGQVYPCTKLWSDKDVRWTFSQLVSPRWLETDFYSGVRRVRGRGLWQRSSQRQSWPSDWPQSSQLDVIHLYPGLRRLERAHDFVKRQQTVPEELQPVQKVWPGLLDSSRPADLVQITHSWGPDQGLIDYEQRWGCPQGHLWGGQHDLSQAFFLRPFPDYSAPEIEPAIELCGVSANPGDFSGRSALRVSPKVALT